MVFALLVLPAIAAGIKQLAVGVEKYRIEADLDRNKQHQAVLTQACLLNDHEVEVINATEDPAVIGRINVRGVNKWKAAQRRAQKLLQAQGGTHG